MNAEYRGLLESASLKIKSGAPWTMTDAERGWYAEVYGPRALEEVLTVKADPPPKPPKPAPAPSGVSSATLLKVLDNYSDQVLVVLKHALAPGAARLTAIESHVNGLSKVLDQALEQRDAKTAALTTTVEALRAQLELRDQVRDLRAAVLDLQADRAATREPVP